MVPFYVFPLAIPCGPFGIFFLKKTTIILILSKKKGIANENWTPNLEKEGNQLERNLWSHTLNSLMYN
jgi:hypothetical protein